MSAMDNRDEVLQLLERFTRLKQKEIPRELEDYLSFVARTGDTVYPWAAVKYFFRTKLSHVIMDFHDNTPSIADLPKCPNVDPFCYDRMKRTLLSRMESFNSAPFTIQRICELLNEPRKHYTRIDKFMRAVEKNILVVSTQEPGRRRSDSENGDSLDSIVNGDLEVNVDIEMDNEAFGIDTNEVAPNAGVAALVPSVNITTPAHAEEVPPTMEPEIEEQGAEKQRVPDNEPELACSDGNDGDLKPEETISPEVNGSDKDESGTAEDAAVPIEKDAYSVDAQHSAPEASKLEQPTVAPTPDVVDSVADVVHEPEELEEPVTVEQPTAAAESVSESLNTNKSPEPSVTLATGTENQSVDDGEPKAKMAKLSQEAPEAETNAPQSATEEPTTEPELAESNTAPLVATSTEDLSESDVVSVFPSAESLQTADSDTTSGSCLISSDEPLASSAISIPSTTSTDSNPDTALTTVEDVSSVLETPAEPEHTDVDESANSEESTPIEPSDEVTPVEEELLVKTTDLEAHEAPEDVPEQPPTVQTDEMETVPSATVAAAGAVPENVMATDDEDQPVVPMAADATETTSKPDENAMDIDESSVEPMDQ